MPRFLSAAGEHFVREGNSVDSNHFTDSDGSSGAKSHGDIVSTGHSPTFFPSYQIHLSQVRTYQGTYEYELVLTSPRTTTNIMSTRHTGCQHDDRG
jgi:hypothetical protein